MRSTNKDDVFIAIKKQHVVLAFAVLLIVVGLAAFGLISG